MDSTPNPESRQDLDLTTSLQKLSVILEEHPESLALGSSDIRAAALEATKHIFDISVQAEQSSIPHINDLVTSLAPSKAPKTRSKANAESENVTGSVSSKNVFQFTPLKSLFIDGMDEEQVWAQLDLRTETVCKLLDFVLEGGSATGDMLGDEEEEEEEDDDDELDSPEESRVLMKAIKALQRGEDVDMDELAKYGIDAEELEQIKENLVNGPDFSDEDSEIEDDDEEGEGEDEDEDDSEEEEEEGMAPLRDPSDEENEKPKSILRQSASSFRKKKKAGHPELDDGFFSLSEFNAETERAESKSSSRGRLAGDDSDDEDMDVDLFTNVDLTQDMDAGDVETNDAELYYADFFEPPPRSVSTASPTKTKAGNKKGRVQFHEEVRVKKIRPTGKNRPLNYDSEEDESDSFDDFGNGSLAMEDMDMEGEFYNEDKEGESDDEDEDEEMNGTEGEEEDEDEGSDSETQKETIDRLKNDLFADDEEVEDDLTTHQRRMVSLKEQISELESENVAPKEWVLMGEAASRQRPQNSLLEEDLEFDRVMKAVPVTTEESIKTLEEKIKARILENEFDDVVRIRPLEDKPFLPSKFLELQDTKSKQSLAQIYENDYVASQAGGHVVDDRDGKLKKEHDEITAMWENICGKLDALCNAHFVPKQPKATISTVTNVATATLESALPTTKSTSTMLAPEEVFAASSSSLKAHSELTPAEKRTQRTKERKLKKRQRDSLEKNVDKFAKPRGIGGVKKQKQAALESVVKHGKGVTVVGKKGVTGSKDKRKK